MDDAQELGRAREVATDAPGIPASCRSFDRCSAPICPLDPEVHRAIWYPHEDICARQRRPERWIRQQKKIAKRVAYLGLEAGFFTLEMLRRNCAVTRAMRGITSDQDPGPQFERWFERHPARKIPELSPEVKEARARAAAKGRETRARNRARARAAKGADPV